jgi:Mitochondrial carrier protein
MREQHGNDTKASRKALVDAFAAVFADVVAVWALYPLDFYKTRLQTTSSSNRRNKSSSHNQRTNVSRTELNEQPTSLDCIRIGHYDGIGMKTIQAAASSFSYFYLYSWIASRYTTSTIGRRSHQSSPASKESALSPQIRLLLTALAAMGNTLLTLPLDVVATQRQVRVCSSVDCNADNNTELLLSGESAYGPSHVGCPTAESGYSDLPSRSDWSVSFALLRVAFCVLSVRMRKRLLHVRQYWRGLWPALILCSNPAINYTIYDAVKVRYISRRAGRTDLTFYEAFALGLIAKFASTIATYPLIAAKTKMMSKQRVVSKSLIQCLRDDYRDGGASALYRGCNVQLYHTVLKSALMMMLKEKITAAAYKIIHG